MAFDPKAVGDKLIVVGNEQIATGKNLSKSANDVRLVADVFKDNGQLDRSLGAVENGMTATRNLLTPIASALHSIASVLNGISIPTIEFQTQSVDLPLIGRVRFVSSLSISSARPLRGVAASTNSVADDIDDIRTALLNIAEAMVSLQNEMPKIQKAVLDTADDLGQGGKNLTDAGTALKESGVLLGGS